MAYELTYIESYAVAAFIAGVVSLDVGGLLISQNGEFKGELGLRWCWKAFVHSFLHASFHAVLFYLYFVGLNWAMILPDWVTIALTEAIKWLGLNLSFDANSARTAILFMFSSLIVVFVWVTYSNKIVENHATKVAKDNNYISSARIDVRFIYFSISWIQWLFGKFVVFVQRKLLRKIFWSPTEWPQWLIQVCLCLAVAVDMLAVASFIRVWFKDARDPGSETSTGGNELVHFNFGNSAFEDHKIFALIIFAGVFIISFFVIWASGGLHEERAKKCLKRFRAIEPWFVFWLLLIALDHLFGNKLTGLAEFWFKVIISCFFGCALMRLLVLYHGKENVDAMVDAGYNALSTHQLSSTKPFRDTDFVRDFGSFLGWVLIALALLTVGGFVSFGGEAGSRNPFANLLIWMSLIGTVASLVLLYLPANWWPARAAASWETKVDMWLDGAAKNGKEFFRKSIYLTLVYALILIYMHISFSNLSLPRMLSAPSSELFLAPLLTVLISYWVIFFFIERRTKRGSHFASIRVASGQQQLKPNFGDLLTALSLVVFGLGLGLSIFEKFS